MNPHNSGKRIVLILSASGLVALLAVSLAARVSARTGSELASAHATRTLTAQLSAPAGNVPEPRPIVLAELPTPFCWGCSWNRNAPLTFQVDLDLLAPLGDGPENAAHGFRRFARGPGQVGADAPYLGRLSELTINGKSVRAFAGDDPLLLEAERWVDQSTLSFYPEIWELRGMDTQLPDLMLMLHLSRSWAARGQLSDDPREALADFRRAIRLGRLLRQDDVTIIQDLVAIACIKIGTEAIYELAREQGDAPTMTVAALVLADKDAMRQVAARRITTLEHAVTADDPEAETLTLRMNDSELESILELIREVPERRYRLEGLIGLHFVKQIGTASQRTKALAALGELAASEDEATAGMARRFLEEDLAAEVLRKQLTGNH